MTATLQEAITAARQGQTARAQLLTADVIQTNPNDANAWYLMSQLVESDARRAAYLGRVLALDPAHERARAEFDALPLEVTDQLLPAAETQQVTEEAMAISEATATTLASEAELAAPAGAPEWLQPLSPEPVAATSVAAPPAAQPVTTARPPAPPARKRNGGNQALTVMLVLLGLLTLVVLAFLVYLLFL